MGGDNGTGAVRGAALESGRQGLRDRREGRRWRVGRGMGMVTGMEKKEKMKRWRDQERNEV